ncbi:MAG: hypothetical protein HY556_00830 [Euryarchaeota archaeon]|nr:hypothetical protein [Euryarchaeota archaeon]
MEDESSLEKNSEWFAKQNLRQFVGKWVSVVDQEIIAVDKSLQDVIRATQEKAPGKEPYVVMVPEGYITV